MRTAWRLVLLPFAVLLFAAAAALALFALPARRTGRLGRAQVFVLGAAVSLAALLLPGCSPVAPASSDSGRPASDGGVIQCYEGVADSGGPAVSDSGRPDAGMIMCYEQVLDAGGPVASDSGRPDSGPSDSGFPECYDCYFGPVDGGN